MRVAVVGAGEMGRNHVRVLRETPKAELVGVADLDLGRAQALGHKYGVDAYASYQEMFDKARPEAVVVVVPTVGHVPVTMDAIRQGLHVLVEKPIAATSEEAEVMVTAAESAGVTLAVGHVERFNPAVIALKDYLDRGALGEIYLVHSRRLSPFPRRILDVGVAADLATHELDMMRYIVGSEVSSLKSEISQVLHPTHEDIVFGLLRFESGPLGILNINWVTPTKVRDLSVTGERGMFTVNYLTQELFFYANSAAPRSQVGNSWLVGHDFTVDEGDMTRLHIARREPLLSELESFIEAASTNSKPVVSGNDGLQALRLAEKVVAEGRHGAVRTGAGSTWN